jgi:hypothetical protein
MATSSISENKELNFAIESVIEKISEELALDVPGVPGQEYYDYPGAKDTWLASLQPIVDVNGTPYDTSDDLYIWPHITDLYGDNFGMPQYPPNYYDPDNRNNLAQWDSTRPSISDKYIVSPYRVVTRVVSDYEAIGYTIQDNRGDWNVNADLRPIGARADADGDGVADSRWVIIPDLNTSKGRPIYAAVRIIDNGGMLNVNTAIKFNTDKNVLSDPLNQYLIDGKSQWQVNLEALGRGGDQIDAINNTRGLPGDLTRMDYETYERDVIWRIDGPSNIYTPFDISDELILRNRYFVDQNDTITRLKYIWPGTFDRRGAYGRNFPYQQDIDLPAWFDKAGNGDSPFYSPRHIATTYNMDRIINPVGAGFYDGKMVNVNNTDDPNYLEKLSESIRRGLYDAGFGNNALADQIAVNIKDYVDSDSEVTSYNGYYGFESPCIYISELAYKFVPSSGQDDPDHHSYAVELCNRYPNDGIPDNWRLVIDDNDDDSITVAWNTDEQYHVIINEDPVAPLDVSPDIAQLSDKLIFNDTTKIELQRKVVQTDNEYIEVEFIYVPHGLVKDVNGVRTYQRDITKHVCIRRLWNSFDENQAPTLGSPNEDPDVASEDLIQAHPANKPFTNIGEIGMIFCKSAYSQSADPIGTSDTEATVRVNLANPKFRQLFKYLTVIDPTEHIDPPDRNNYANEQEYYAAYQLFLNETRIKGRVNINTAPWFVIAQLPWVTHPVDPTDIEYLNRYDLAKAIVAYRDKGVDNPDDPTVNYTNRTEQAGIIDLAGFPVQLREELGFETIGELATVVNGSDDVFRSSSMRYYKYDGDQTEFPDLTPNDDAPDDFEERDLIFSRISNLVTVRSDVFTAYILVRIGADGPQKRVLAILDRSDVTSSGDKVRILALHPVPDPR